MLKCFIEVIKIMDDNLITANELRKELENIKCQVELTIKKQLDLFYDKTLSPYQEKLVEYPIRIKELEIEKHELLEEIHKTKHYNELLNEKLVTLQDDIDSFSKVSQVIRTERKKAELQSKVDDLEKMIEKLKKENQDLQKTNTQLNHKIECIFQENNMLLQQQSAPQTVILPPTVEVITHFADHTETMDISQNSSEPTTPSLIDTNRLSTHTETVEVVSTSVPLETTEESAPIAEHTTIMDVCSENITNAEPVKTTTELYLYKLYIETVSQKDHAVCGYECYEIHENQERCELFQDAQCLEKYLIQPLVEYHGLFLALKLFTECTETRQLTPSLLDIYHPSTTMIQQINGLKRATIDAVLKLKKKCDELIYHLRDKGWEIEFVAMPRDSTQNIALQKATELLNNTIVAADEENNNVTNEQYHSKATNETLPSPVVEEAAPVAKSLPQGKKKAYRVLKASGKEYIVNEDDELFSIVVDENGKKTPGAQVGRRNGANSIKLF